MEAAFAPALPCLRPYGKAVAGVLPMLDVDIEDEKAPCGAAREEKKDALLDIRVIRLPASLIHGFCSP